ncbi:hypothetical protein JN11_03639 [Mucilaginibacter frigoritolerans]|uniref:Uncharacterized protein n=1 Tax=Mucilaginibacter frigoritolerans TaxID=652788 RepID=A0A562TU91_9SPHI|nr:hypothetical protein [Mucilaginibacter frigoritolerans]TWI97179.1 hypothetical protein JN11_03639 [Mucilaginibacter frigoritolerans]
MSKAANKKPFIYYESLKPWETVCMLLYAIVTVGVTLTLVFAKPETKLTTIIMYIVLSQLGMYFGLYTSLRNFTSYLLWLGFGVVHILLFLFFRGSPTIEIYHGNPTIGLLNTIVLLLLFQFLRYVSLKIQHREFVAPAKGGGPDLFENKKLTFADFVIFVIYMGTWFGLTMLSISM